MTSGRRGVLVPGRRAGALPPGAGDLSSRPGEHGVQRLVKVGEYCRADGLVRLDGSPADRSAHIELQDLEPALKLMELSAFANAIAGEPRQVLQKHSDTQWRSVFWRSVVAIRVRTL